MSLISTSDQHWKIREFLSEMNGFLVFGGRFGYPDTTRLRSHCLEPSGRVAAALFRLGMCLPVSTLAVILAGGNTLGLPHSFL